MSARDFKVEPIRAHPRPTSRDPERTAKPGGQGPSPRTAVRRALGNRTYGGFVQAKLRVSAPNDPYEREADQVADQVMRMPAGGRAGSGHGPGMAVGRLPMSSIQRKCTACRDDEERVQRKPTDASVSPVVQRKVAEPEEEKEDLLQPKQVESSHEGQFSPGSESGMVQRACDPVIQSAPAAVQRQCGCGGECPQCSGDETRIRTKLKMGAAGDPYEREADRVAAQVMRMPVPSSSGLGTSPPPPGPRRAARDSFPGGSGRDAPGSQGMGQPGLATPSHSGELTSGGTPLEPGLRRFFESRFGRDLSAVRLHTGAESESWNEGLNAHAFTYGNHVWLGRRQSSAPDYLLAHELTHVIQQSQPRSLDGADSGGGALAGNSGPPPGGPSIQRLELSEPFWIPLGAKGKRGGSDIHKELLGLAEKNNSKLDFEAPAPNASAKDWGVGLQGSIDLYEGDTMPGLYFDGRPRGAHYPEPERTEPKKHYRAALKGAKAGRFKPYVRDGVIHEINQGPQGPKLGELKPAVRSMLDKGDSQLTNYEEGLKMAARLTNDWAARNKKTERWNLGEPGRLPAGAVDFKDGSKDLRFNAASPRADTSLVLGKVAESGSQGAKYEHKIAFNPAKFGLPPIKGGLYAQHYTGGGAGLWMYFARPKNLNDVLKLVRGALIKGEMVVANQVQNQVIDPLLKAPKKISKRSKEAGHPRPRLAAPLRPRIQRAPKTARLEDAEWDKLKFKGWVKNQRALRHKISGPGATEDAKKQIASMELLHKAYKTEEALDKIPGTGKTSLPAKGTDVVKIDSGAGKATKTHRKELSDLGGWLKGWTSKPAEVLGYFRDKFGNAFVSVANKFIELRESIRKKFQEHFDRKSDLKRKSGKGKIILQALAKALKQAAKILLPRTLHLVMDAIQAGLEKKLAKVFDLDPARMLEDTFGAEFKKWSAQLDNYRQQANTFIKATFDKYTKDLGWIQDLNDLGKKIGPILEAAAAGIQCATPPVWGCVKLLARKLTDCAIAKAMNICRIQREIAELTINQIKPLRELPTVLGQEIMAVLKAAAPKGLKDIFDEPLAAAPAFDPKEVDCEFTPLPSGCPNWGLIELEGGEGAPPKEAEEGTGAGEEEPKAEPGKPPPKPHVGPRPKGEGTSPEKDDATRKLEEFLEKLTKEELDELYREGKRQGLLDSPIEMGKAKELVEKVRKSLKAKKERARKRRAEAREKKKSKGKAGEGEKGPNGSPGKGSTAPGECVWDPSQLSVGGFVLRGSKDVGFDILDEGHTHTQPFDNKSLFSCGGITLTFKNDFSFGCQRQGAFTKPVVSTKILFTSGAGEKVLFQKTDSNPWANEYFAEPEWGSFIELGHINTNGDLKINVRMRDPDTGITKAISAQVPIDVNCG